MGERKDLGLTAGQERGKRITTVVMLAIIVAMLGLSYATREVYQGAIFKNEVKSNADKPGMGQWH
jgi:cytochrome c oxidase assembly protein Cox11